MAEPVLEMKGICKSFGPIDVLKQIHFDLNRGEVHALLGENGAGKSTLIKVLGGIYSPDSGEIRIGGEKVNIQSVHDAEKYGIGIIHQEIVLVPYLTVTQNIFLGREITSKYGKNNMAEMNRQADMMVKRLGLDIDVTTPVRELSIAHQQLVEIVKASSFHVRILVMDEPTSSLSDEDVANLFHTIRTLQKQGVSVIYISHRMEELFEISDRVTVIRDGEYVGTKITKQTNSDELVAMMVGRSLTNYYTRTYNELNQVVLEVKNLTQKGVFENVSFKVHAGEILGFAGLIGAGRSEVMQAVFGSRKIDSGEIYLNGEAVRFRNCHDAIKHSIAMVPEDRKVQGLILKNSVGFNLSLVDLDELLNGIALSEKKRGALVDGFIRKLRIKTSSSEQEVSSLSGGNQQKVVLAKWLAIKPKLLILDEPTRGVDVGAKSEIYSIINDAAREGMAVIMISSDLPEVMNMCDNVCVMQEGHLRGELSRQELSQERIMSLATGGVQR